MEWSNTASAKTYTIAGAETTPGTPKSDFHLLDPNGKETVWISHKDGTTPRHFQQWSGVTRQAGDKIFNHPEVQKFGQDLKQYLQDEFGVSNMVERQTFARKIQDINLQMYAVYGPDYGKKFGRNNVTIVLQGPIKLVNVGNFYQLESNHTLINGQKITGPYEPVLIARPSSGRQNLGVRGARIMIAPVEGRRITAWI